MTDCCQLTCSAVCHGAALVEAQVQVGGLYQRSCHQAMLQPKGMSAITRSAAVGGKCACKLLHLQAAPQHGMGILMAPLERMHLPCAPLGH